MLTVRDIPEMFRLTKENPNLTLEEIEGKIPRSLLGTAGKAIQSGVNQWEQTALTAQQMLGHFAGSEYLEKSAETGIKNLEREAKRFAAPPEISKDLLDDPAQLLKFSYWFYNLPQVATSMLPSLLVGGMVGKGVQILGQTFKLTPTLIAKLARISGITAGGLVGGFQEGTQTFQDLKKLGVSDEDATKGMVVMTAASAALNALSLGKMTKGAPSGAVRKVLHWFGVANIEAGGEWGEEPVDALLKLKLAPDKYTKEDFKKQMYSSPNVIPSSFAMGGGGAMIYDAARGTETERLQTPPVEPAPAPETKPPIYTQPPAMTPEGKAKLLTPEGALEFATNHPDIVDNLLNAPEGVEADSHKRFRPYQQIIGSTTKGERRQILDLLRSAKEQLAKPAAAPTETTPPGTPPTETTPPTPPGEAPPIPTTPPTKEGDLNVPNEAQGQGEEVAPPAPEPAPIPPPDKALRLRTELLTPRGAERFLQKHSEKAGRIQDIKTAKEILGNIFQDDKEIYDFIELLWKAKEQRNNTITLGGNPTANYFGSSEFMTQRGVDSFYKESKDVADNILGSKNPSETAMRLFVNMNPNQEEIIKFLSLLGNARAENKKQGNRGWKKKGEQAFAEEPINEDTVAASEHLDDYLEEASLIDDMFNAANMEEETQAFKETPGQQPAPVPPPAVQQAPAGPVAYNVSDQDIGNQKPISPIDAIKSIVTAFKLPALRDVKRFPRSLKGALAIYTRREHVADILKKRKNEVGAVVHEVGHHIDNIYKIIASIPAAMKDEVAALDYDPTTKRLDEGWAEFFRVYMMQDERNNKGTNKAEALAPNFFRYFEDTILPNNPELAKSIKISQPIIERLRFQGREKAFDALFSQDRTKSRWQWREGISIYDNLVDIGVKTWRILRYGIQNRGNFIGLFEEKIRKGGGSFAPGESPTEYLHAGTTIAKGFARRAIDGDGVYDIVTGERIGDPFNKAFEGLKSKNIPVLKKYWAAWHVLDEYNTAEAPRLSTETDEQYKNRIQAGEKTGISKETAQYNYDLIEDRLNSLNQNWKPRLAALTAFHKSLVLMLEKAAVISPESSQRIRNSKNAYAPLSRVLEATSDFQTRQKAYINLSNPIQRRGGSVEKIRDLLHQSVEMTQRFYIRAHQQQVINVIHKAWSDNGGVGDQVHKVLPKTEIIKFSAEQLFDQLEKHGIDIAALGALKADDILYVFKPDYYVTQKRKGEFVGRIQMPDGKQELFAFDRDLYQGLYGTETWVAPIVLDWILGKPTRLLKGGATGFSMAFNATNYLVDTVTGAFQKEPSETWVQGLKNGSVDPAYFSSAWLYTIVQNACGNKGDPTIERLISLGCDMNMWLTMDIKQTKILINGLDKNTTAEKAMGMLKHPGEIIEEARKIFSTSEVGHRAAAFYNSLIMQGWTLERMKTEEPPMAVLRKAVIAFKERTVDFSKTGAWMQPVTQLGILGPYLGASIQGIDAFFRTAKRNPWRFFAGTAILSALYIGHWYQRHNDDDYDEQPAWLRWLYTTFSKDGKVVLRLKVPREYGALAMAPVAILEQWFDKRPGAMADFLEQSFKANQPLAAPSVAPVYGAWNNLNVFTESKIVNEQINAGTPANQYNEDTSKAMIAIGKLLPTWTHWSPAKMGYVLDNLIGGAGTQYGIPLEKILLGTASYSDIPGVSRFTLKRDYSVTINEYYEERDRLRPLAADEKNRRGAMNPKDKLRYAELQKAEPVFNELRHLNILDPNLGVDKYMIGFARKIMGKEPKKIYIDLISGDAKDMPEAVRDVRTRYLGRLLDTIGAPKTDPEDVDPKTIAKKIENQAEEQKAALLIFKNTGLSVKEAIDVYKEYQILGHKEKKTWFHATTAYNARVSKFAKALTQK